jgi:RHS repeat-associated protein
VKTHLTQQNRNYSAFRRGSKSLIGDNLRVRKTTGAGDVTNYLYDGLQLLAETDGAGAVKKLYNPGISVTDDKGNKFFYLHDGRGNVANLIDKDGNIVDSYSYDAFGKAVGVSKNQNEFLHDGLEAVMADMDVQLEYMWNRWYDPDLGRFISRDPIGFAGGDLNLYAFVGNNPIGRVDPLGLTWVDASAGFGDALLFGAGPYLRGLAGVQSVNTNDSDYTSGELVGFAASFAAGYARIAYAGAAQGASALAATGARANVLRETFKAAFRGGYGWSRTEANAARFAAKYATDAELLAAAGRTNIFWNLAGFAALRNGYFGLFGDSNKKSGCK